MTLPETARSFPPSEADEQALLDGWLDYYRATLLHKCVGLSPQHLVARSCPPSTMSLIGLVRHMTEMERVYVHRLAEADLPLRYVTQESPDADFNDVDPDAAEAGIQPARRPCRPAPRTYRRSNRRVEASTRTSAAGRV